MFYCRGVLLIFAASPVSSSSKPSVSFSHLKRNLNSPFILLLLFLLFVNDYSIVWPNNWTIEGKIREDETCIISHYFDRNTDSFQRRNPEQRRIITKDCASRWWEEKRKATITASQLRLDPSCRRGVPLVSSSQVLTSKLQNKRHGV